MQTIIDNATALIMLYAPVIGTYLIQIVQWVIMWAKNKKLLSLVENKTKQTAAIIDANEVIIKENYELKQKINKLISLLQQYEEKNENAEIKKN